MNTTTLNHEQIEQNYFDCESLKDLMETIEKDMQASGEVVCQFIVNGMALHENDEKRLHGTPITDVQSLEIRSERPAQLLFEVLKNWEIEIPGIVSQTDTLAQNIRAKGPEGQYTAFVNLIDSCQFLIESLVSMDTVIDTAAFLDRHAWTKSEDQMSVAVGQALDCFERKDFAVLADVLEYDLANSLQSWFDLLKGLNRDLQEENERDSRALNDRIFKKSGPAESDPLADESSAGDRGPA